MAFVSLLLQGVLLAHGGLTTLGGNFSHVVDLVPLFMNKIAILSRGQILCYGTPEEVFGDPDTIEKAKLNLSLVAELMRLSKTRDQVKLHHIPLTVGEARHEILRLLSVNDVMSRV